MKPPKILKQEIIIFLLKYIRVFNWPCDSPQICVCMIFEQIEGTPNYIVLNSFQTAKDFVFHIRNATMRDRN